MNKRVGFIVTHCLLADHVSSHLMLNGGLGKRTRKRCHEDAVVIFSSTTFIYVHITSLAVQVGGCSLIRIINLVPSLKVNEIQLRGFNFSSSVLFGDLVHVCSTSTRGV